MTKTGAGGDLTFGEDNESDDSDTDTDESASSRGVAERRDDQPQTEASQAPAADSTEESVTEANQEEYPYFVRRSKTLDERTERIEVWVRPDVTANESAWLDSLADALGTDQVAKTDAREYALLVAQEDEAVQRKIADRMEADGYGMFE